LSGQDPAEDHDIVVDPPAGVLDGGGGSGSRRDTDARLDPGLFGSTAYEAEIGAIAAQQAKGRDDHGLAGAGLTGDDGESLGQLELGRVDHAERRES
jgi:hypothetical protein